MIHWISSNSDLCSSKNTIKSMKTQLYFGGGGITVLLSRKGFESRIYIFLQIFTT